MGCSAVRVDIDFMAFITSEVFEAEEHQLSKC